MTTGDEQRADGVARRTGDADSAADAEWSVDTAAETDDGHSSSPSPRFIAAAAADTASWGRNSCGARGTAYQPGVARRGAAR